MMHEDELRTNLPQAMDHRLSGLTGDPFLARRIIVQEKREEPVMKKKLSLSLVLALALVLVTLSAAVALMHSTIGDKLFGGNTPEDVAERILTPQSTVETTTGNVTIDELLYDGSALHMAFTIMNAGEEPLLYTVDGISLNGVPVTYDGLAAEGAGDAGYLLGGEVEGTALPGSVTLYNKAAALHLFDENGQYLGMGELPEGHATLTLSVAVWRPINAPKLVDYDDFEGVNVTEKADSLLADGTGYSMLWLMRPESMQVNYTAGESGALAYASVYKELGWAELLEINTISIPVELTEGVPRAEMTVQRYRWNDLTIAIDRFNLASTGGVIEGAVYGDEAAAEAFLKDGLQAADRAGNRVLSVGCWTEEYDAALGGMRFTVSLGPVTGDLPATVMLAPMLADNPRWDPAERLYDPNLEKPEGVIGSGQFDLTRSIEITLEIP